MEPERALLLVDRHTSGRESLRRGLLTWLERHLRSLPKSQWYTPDASVIVAQVRAGQQSVGGLTWQYMDLLGTTARGSVSLGGDLRGVSDEDVWERPAKEYRYQRAMGLDHEAAVDAAVRRAATIADDDLSLAMREAARQHASRAPGVTGLRRVIHPEMSTGGTCGLCIAASDRVYGVQDLMPIHAHCRCTVAEVTRISDPGSGLNNLSLDDLYSTGGGTDAASLKRTRYKVNEHGELGPVLAPKDANWRGPAEVKADTGERMNPAAKRDTQVATLERSLASLEERAAAGEDVSAPLTYQRELLARLRRKAS